MASTSCCSRPDPVFAHSEREWSHFENEANNPATGVFRFGPGDRTQAAVGPRPAAELLPLADRRRRRLDPALLRQLAACDAGRVLRLHRADSAALRPGSRRALRVPRADPVLRMGRAHAARADSGDGDEGGALPPRRRRSSVCRTRHRRTSPSPPTGRRRTRSSSRRAPPGGRTIAKKLVVSAARGLHVLRALPAGLHRAAEVAAQPAREALDARELRADGAHRRSLDAAGRRLSLTRMPSQSRVETDGAEAATRVSRGATSRTGATTTEAAKVVVLAAGPIETPRLWLNSGLPNPERSGRPRPDRSLPRLPRRHGSRRTPGSSKGPTSAARLDFPGFGGLEQAGVSPGLQGQALHVQRFRDRRLLRQRRSARARGVPTRSAALSANV